MLVSVYILYSETADRHYIGQTSDLTERLKVHNAGQSASTKSGVPWKLVYTEEYPTRSEAVCRERQLKRMKSRKYIEELINSQFHSNR